MQEPQGGIQLEVLHGHGRWPVVHQMLPHPWGAGPDHQQTVLQMPLALDAAMQQVKPS